MTKRRKWSGGAVLLLLLLVACRPGIPEQYIQPDEMEDLLYDYHLSQSMARTDWSSEEERNYRQTEYFAAVLEKHGVTKAQFDSSMVYYFTRADRLQEVYERVSKRLSEEAMRLGASEGEVNRFSQLNAEGDTANVWEGNSTLVLMPYPPYNRIDFEQKADTTYKKGDSFLLFFATDFLYQSGSKEAVVCLTLKSDNDSIVSRANHVAVTGNTQMRIPELKDHALKELKGFIYLGPGSEQSSTFKLMYIHNLQLIRMRTLQRDTTSTQRADSAATAPKSMNAAKDSASGSADSLMRPQKIEVKKLE